MKKKETLIVVIVMLSMTTQAGFRKFVKWWCNDNDFMGYLEGYPTSYPAIVKMSTGYRGYYYPLATYIVTGKQIGRAHV